MFERIFDPSGWGSCRGSTPGGGRFEVHDHGAHITQWVPSADASPVLWTSPTAKFEPTVAIRGGIPICFPWFGTGRKTNKYPAHGFARLARWQLLEGRETNGVTTLRWLLDETMIPRLDGIDPDRNRFEITATQTFDSQLTIVMRLRNTDNVPLVVEQALHTYLHVGDIRRASVHGLGGKEFFDQIRRNFDTQIGAVEFTRELDRIYWVDDTVEVHDPVLRRRIVLDTHNSETTVVWNPWAEKTAGLSDMPDDAWESMVCVETSNVRNKAVHLNPGQAHELRLTLSVADL